MAGLREQKKAETREAIGLAAARLASERGLDCVTVDDIAEAAGVARRTFRNYFPNKESAILHAVDRVLTVRRLSLDAPALRVRWAGTHSEASLSLLTAAIAERTGTDPAVDVYPRVVTHAAWGVLVSALDMQSGDDGDSSRLIERVRIGFATLASGMSPTC